MLAFTAILEALFDMRHRIAVIGAIALGFFVLAAGACGASTAQDQPLLRFPNSNGTSIVFSARGHVWSVAKLGGIARRLTDGTGYEFAPRYSPDGRHAGNRRVRPPPHDPGGCAA